MKSETGIRHKHSCFTLNTDLIIHHSITNIPNQTPELLCILGILEETLNVPLLGQQLKSLKNVLQFATNPCSSGVNLNLGTYELTVPVPSFSFLLCHCFQEQVCRVRQRGL